MNSVLVELSIIFALLAANGVFSMAEIAIVSARKAKLRERAAAGDRRAGLALQFAESPNTFLATVQIGITLVGVLAAAFSGAAIAARLAVPLQGVSWLAPYADLSEAAPQARHQETRDQETKGPRARRST